MVILRELNLISGPFPWLLGSVVAAMLLVAIGRRPRWLMLGLVLAVSVLAVVTIRVLLPASIDVARIPPSFYLWTIIPLVAIGISLTSWPTAGGRRRAAGIMAVPLAILFGANEVNAWFAYLPTAADVAGAAIEQQISPASLGNPVRAGVVLSVDIPATTSGFAHRPALVWLPPAAQRTPRPMLPVVMMLAGTPGAPKDLLRAADIAAIASDYASGHGGVAPILVFPDHNGSFAGDTECVNSPKGNAETYLTVDVVRYVTEAFGSAGTRWGIFGYSEGGTCALTLTLRHPELFTAFVDIGGDLRPNLGGGAAREQATIDQLFDGSQTAWAAHDPQSLLQSRRYDGIAGRFIAGTADGPARRNMATLAPAAEAAGLDVTTITAHGHHSFQLVTLVAPESLAWLAARLAPPQQNQTIANTSASDVERLNRAVTIREPGPKPASVTVTP